MALLWSFPFHWLYIKNLLKVCIVPAISGWKHKRPNGRRNKTVMQFIGWHCPSPLRLCSSNSNVLYSVAESFIFVLSCGQFSISFLSLVLFFLVTAQTVTRSWTGVCGFHSVMGFVLYSVCQCMRQLANYNIRSRLACQLLLTLNVSPSCSSIYCITFTSFRNVSFCVARLIWWQGEVTLVCYDVLVTVVLRSVSGL